MMKRIYVPIGILLGILAILLPVAYYCIQRQAILEQRYHLLCETLEPGMSRNEVLRILRQVGDITVREVDWPSGFSALDVRFVDSKVSDQYGFFSIVFIDDKYARAVVPRGSDNPEYICDFRQTTEDSINSLP